MFTAHPLRTLFVVLVACCALAGGHASAAPQSDPVADFKKYFKEYSREYQRAGKDDKERRAAVVTIRETVLSLKGVDSADVVDAILPTLKLEEPDIQSGVVTVLSSFKSEPPIARLVEVMATEKHEPTLVACLQAFQAAKYKTSGAALAKLLSSKSWEVRRASVQALAASGEADAPKWIVAACKDEEPAVRFTAMDALAAAKSKLVLPFAINALSDPIWQVRASAIRALSMVRAVEAIDPLIRRLEVEKGRLTPDLVEALSRHLGREFGNDAKAWRAYWDNLKDGYILMTEEQVRELRKGLGPRTGADADGRNKSGSGDDDHETKAVSYHDITTPSISIIFVIDVSGSMENMVVEKDRFVDGNYPSMMRIDICKTELARTIDRLEPNVRFNILSFATAVKPWKKDLVDASPANKLAARDWVLRLEAIGGNSKDDLARVGLTGSAGLDGGQTNTFGALMAALGVPERGSPVEATYAVKVDTVFFLSDGRPSTGDYVDTDDILREILRANELRKIVLHTIAIGEFQKDFMKALAEQNGGIFVDLGR
ncbi:MAG: HEAT repeat domain-containing protein [Planctomycetes bacterium]|nr:HEAT repeat domain-containing protein [Planctomycetota bacterium]